MMNKTVIIGTGVIVLFLSSAAYSAQGMYVGGILGYATPEDSDVTDSTLPGITISIEADSGFSFGGVLGYDMGNNVRIEGEIAYQSNDLDTASALGVSFPVTGDSSVLTFGVNGYYDFVNQSNFTPFITAGLGLAYVEVDDMNVPGSGLPSLSDDDTVFAYQLGAGVGYEINPKVTVDLRYRYQGLSDPDIDTSTVEMASHNFYLGIRVAL